VPVIVATRVRRPSIEPVGRASGATKRLVAPVVYAGRLDQLRPGQAKVLPVSPRVIRVQRVIVATAAHATGRARPGRPTVLPLPARAREPFPKLPVVLRRDQSRPGSAKVLLPPVPSARPSTRRPPPVLLVTSQLARPSGLALVLPMSVVSAPTPPAVIFTRSIRGRLGPPVHENRRLYRGSGGGIGWNLALDPPPLSGGYASWVVLYEITWTNPTTGVTTLAYSQTLTHIDDVNGVFQLQFASSVTASTNLPQPVYDEKWWRTDQNPNRALLRYGKLILLGLEMQ
jgi:hypothetical protein